MADALRATGRFWARVGVSLGDRRLAAAGASHEIFTKSTEYED